MSQLTDITCLYEITRALASTMDLRQGLEEIMAVLAEKKEMKHGTVTIINPVSGQLEIEVAPGLSREARDRGKYKIGEGITGRVVASGAPIVVPRISEEPLFLNRTGSRAGRAREASFICVPIKQDNETIGALSVDREYRKGIDFDDDLRFLTVVSSLIAQSVTRIQAINEEHRRLAQENTMLRRELSGKYQFDNIVSASSRMQEVFGMMSRVAEANATVLLRGESGTGKTLIAKAIHYNSGRAEGPFVTVNCSALPETLLEAELFGHEKGAFTGAHTARPGRFEQAESGTLFLDEIGELSPAVQIKLLNVVQDREYQRVGGTRPIRCNVRIIAATNKNLEEAVRNGSFREDLYYRLNVFPIFLPPLRERKTDIILLAEHFLEKYNRENDKRIRRISTPAIDLLMQYHWPGNVRELENCMERAVLICDEDTIKSYHLPPSLQVSEPQAAGGVLSFSQAVANFERELLIEALKASNGNQTRAAAALKTSLRVVNYKVRKYGIDTSQFKKGRARR